MRRCVLLFCALLLSCSLSMAASLPVSKMQNAVSGVMQEKMQSRGFASNDPRYASTLTGGASYVAGGLASMATITALGVTAPAWVSVAAGLAVGYAVSLAVDQSIKWIYKTLDSVQVGDNPASPNTPAGLVAPQVIYCGDNFVCATSLAGYCAGQPAHAGTYNGQQGTFTYTMGADGHCHSQFKFDSLSTIVDFGALTDPKKSTANVSSCPGINLTASAGICPASNFPEPAAAPVKTLSDAAAGLSAAQKAMPLNPQAIADLSNEIWQNAAAAPGYSGLPYDATNPITAADAATWQAANASSWPSIGDFVAPQPAPTGGTAGSPFSLPTATTPVATADPSTDGQTATNPSTQPLENLGPDPGIGSPTLETIPTAQQILSPLLNLFPTIKNFVVPNHSATCPKWTVHLFDHDIVAQDHCTMLEQARPLASATMAVVWLLIALFIVLAA